MLKDNFNRQHDYLRISLTDACNFRCLYCMPDEKITFMPPASLMQTHEIDSIAREFVNLGVTKIRLTGGEPLLRRDAPDIINFLSKYPVELTLTTNGFRLHEYIDQFKEAGITSVNVSLDTLDKSKFYKITKRDYFDHVIRNIYLLIDHGFHVKVNSVVMRGINDDEILNFVEWTKNIPVHVRFIEFMPFTGNNWNKEMVFSFAEMIELIEQNYETVRLNNDIHATAKKFKPLNHKGTFAIISTMSEPFCSNCNRMRLTADGKMKNCLFSKGEVDILAAFRNGEDIVSLIKKCLTDKNEALGGQFTPAYKNINSLKIKNRSMITIGG